MAGFIKTPTKITLPRNSTINYIATSNFSSPIIAIKLISAPHPVDLELLAKTRFSEESVIRLITGLNEAISTELIEYQIGSNIKGYIRSYSDFDCEVEIIAINPAGSSESDKFLILFPDAYRRKDKDDKWWVWIILILILIGIVYVIRRRY